MEIRVADFEVLSIHFKTYQDGLNSIESRRKEILTEVEPIRKELQQILTATQNGIVVDTKTEEQRYGRFRSLQDNLVKIDKEATIELNKLKEDLTKKTYAELEEIISEWSKLNSVDLVIGKLEVVYLSEKYEITDTILDVLKERDLYVEKEIIEEENEKESV